MWHDALSPLRWLFRGSLFLLHATLGLLPTLLAQSTAGRAIRCGRRTLDVVLLTWWSRWMCRIFGLEPIVRGAPLDGPVLIVANHLSWADIQAFHSVAEMGFVAKAEIAGWPVLGHLASAGGTIFHQRGSRDSAHGVMAQVLDRLSSRGRVAVFPEGGVFPGVHVKRFHARMFKAAQEAGCPVQPAMIRYVRDGRIDPEVTFLAGENFLQNLVRFMGRPTSRAEVVFLEPFDVGDQPRKVLAQRAETAVRAAYEAPVGVAAGTA